MNTVLYTQTRYLCIIILLATLHFVGSSIISFLINQTLKHKIHYSKQILTT